MLERTEGSQGNQIVSVDQSSNNLRHLLLNCFSEYIVWCGSSCSLCMFSFSSVNCFTMILRVCVFFIMAALHSRCRHYIFALWFLLLSILFPRLISAVGDWMCTILLHMVWPTENLGCRSETCCTRLAGNTGRKKSPKIRHLCTVAQFYRAISSQLRHISTVGKELAKQWYLLQMSPQYGELWPTSGWDRSGSLGHPI